MNGAEVDGRRFHREGPEGEPSSVGRGADHVHRSLPFHTAHRPSRDQRIAERPIHVQRQGVEPPVGRAVAAEMSVKRQVREEGVREHQVEVFGSDVRPPQTHDSRIRHREGGEPTGQPAAVVGEVEWIEAHLEHAAVRAERRRSAVQHDAVGESWLEEPEVGQVRRVRVHGEVVAHGIARPAHPPFDRERRLR